MENINYMHEITNVPISSIHKFTCDRRSIKNCFVCYLFALVPIRSRCESLVFIFFRFIYNFFLVFPTILIQVPFSMLIFFGKF